MNCSIAFSIYLWTLLSLCVQCCRRVSPWQKEELRFVSGTVVSSQQVAVWQVVYVCNPCPFRLSWSNVVSFWQFAVWNNVVQMQFTGDFFEINHENISYNYNGSTASHMSQTLKKMIDGPWANAEGTSAFHSCSIMVIKKAKNTVYGISTKLKRIKNIWRLMHHMSHSQTEKWNNNNVRFLQF